MEAMRSSSAIVALALLAAALPGALGLCDYWGVGQACSYDGRYKRPERCKGLGRRYCDRAAEASECPQACQPQNCRKNPVVSFQFNENQFQFKWQDLVLAGDYDMVFTEGDMVCVQTCWDSPWKMKCDSTRTYSGQKYCTQIRCDHDSSNRFVGCHKDRPFHKPTCAECARLFPAACGSMVMRYVDTMEADPAYYAMTRWDGVEDYLAWRDQNKGERLQYKPDIGDGTATPFNINTPSRVSKVKDSDNSDSTTTTATTVDDNSDSGAASDYVKRACDSSEVDSSDSSEVDSSGSTSADCMVQAQADLDAGMLPQSMMDTPMFYESNGTAFMSFNELTFQVEGYIGQYSQKDINAAIAKVVGVNISQVQTVNIQADPDLLLGAASNVTEVGIITITAIVWSTDPFSIDKRLLEMLDSGDMYNAMVDAGLATYLDVSMTPNVLAAPVENMKTVFPDALVYANQELPSLLTGLSVGGIVGVAVGCFVLASAISAAIIFTALFCKKKSPTDETMAAADKEVPTFTETKVAVPAADMESAVDENTIGTKL